MLVELSENVIRTLIDAANDRAEQVEDQANTEGGDDAEYLMRVAQEYAAAAEVLEAALRAQMPRS